MVETMDQHRMYTRVAGQDFPGISRGRVTVENTIYIFTNTDEIIPWLDFYDLGTYRSSSAHLRYGPAL